MKKFSGGEGIWFDSGHGGDGPLDGVDTRAGELFVCEDGGNMEVCVITPDQVVAPFLRLTGPAATGPANRGNELAGVSFSPAGDRMYFSAQRAYGFGVAYEARGPFAGAGAPPPAAPVPRPAAATPQLSVRAPRRVTLAQLRRGHHQASPQGVPAHARAAPQTARQRRA